MAALLRPSPSARFLVVRRRPDGAPVVIENAPLLFDGTPMPTRYWLVDPLLVDAVEPARGGRRGAAAEPTSTRWRWPTPTPRTRPSARPLIEPDQPGPRPSGGVGGTRAGVKCLHAHLAWWLVGGDDPVGAGSRRRIASALAELVLARSDPGQVLGEGDGPRNP